MKKTTIIIIYLILLQAVTAPNMEPVNAQDPRESACIKAAQACSTMLEKSVDKDKFASVMDNTMRFNAAEIEKNTHPIRTLVPLIVFLVLYGLLMLYAKARGWVL